MGLLCPLPNDNNDQQHADVNVNKILIGNKCDMQSERVISTEEGQALAAEYKIDFFETSAKQDINVDKAFVSIAREVKDRLITDGAPNGTGGRTLRAEPTKKSSESGGCCK